MQADQSYFGHLRLPRHDELALLSVTVFAATAFIGCAIAGLRVDLPLHLMLVVPGIFGTTAMLYHLVRPRENRLFQILLYVTLWSLFPVAGTQLTFLANSAALPMRPELFAAIDRAMGFEWIDWANFMIAHPWLEWLSGKAYSAYAFQPYLALILIAHSTNRHRNAQFLLATIIALGVTIVISALVPAAGPGDVYGFKTPETLALEAVRAGQTDALPYVGIVAFPSFHSAMAVLFTAAYRGMPRYFWPAAALNAAMLWSVPYSGDHYLIDVFAGVAIALAAVRLTDRIVPSPCASDQPAGSPSR